MTTSKAFLSVIAAGLCLGLQMTASGQEASLAVSCEAPGRIFTDLKEPSFTFNDVASPKSLDYEVFDWKGVQTGKGAWDTAAKLELKGLPIGYYTLKLSGIEGELSFAIVADPSRRPCNPDTFFAMDTAQSWLTRPKADNPRQPKDGFKTISDICKMAGLTNVRERMSWGEVEKDPFVYSWGRYMANAKLLSERGIKISGMFHDAPKWAKGPSGKLPENLMALHEFCRTVAIAFKGKMNAWEFWNEQDIGFCDQPAWQFAAAQKAAYLGFKAGAPDVPVQNGAFCVYPLGQFAALTFENGIGDYFDVFNYHVYLCFKKYPEIVKNLKDNLARYGRQDAPIWLTENGSSYEGMGRLDTYIKDVKEHDKDQELVMAEFTPKAQILMQSLGIARDYFFVLPAYNEKGGGKVWGLVRYDYSAKPAFVAFSNLTAQLSDAKYLGACEPAKGVRGFLYEKPDKTQTLAFWSESELDTADRETPKINVRDERAVEFSIDIPGACKDAVKLVDTMGSPKAIETKSGALALKSTRYPNYLTGLKGMSPTAAAPAVPAIRAKADESKELYVVLNAKLGENFKTGSKTLATLSAETGKMTLEVYNFSSAWKRGEVSVSGAESFEGLPEQIEIPPYGKASFECKVKANFERPSFQRSLVFTGKFEGKPISPLKIALFSEKACIDGTVAKNFDFGNPDRWRKNTAGEMSISADKAENAVKFDVKFKPSTDHWVYPEYILKKDEESMAGAVGVSFEIKARQKDDEKEYSHNLLMLVTENVHETGKSTNLEYPSPSGKEWTRAYINFSDAPNLGSASDIKMLRLGMNPKKESLSFWVRDMKVLYLK